MTSEARKARKRAQLRQDILVAARDLFMREGYASFSMRKLAQAVECVPGTLYLYFKDKDHIVSHLIEESFEHLMEDLQSRSVTGDPLQTLRGIMCAYVEFGLANPDHYHFAFMLRRTPAMDEKRPAPHRSFDLLRETVAACIDQGIFRALDPELAAQGIWTGIHGVTSVMITMPSFPWADQDRVIDHVLENTVNALMPSSNPEDNNQGASHADR
jgi:AcrR family transcriptional regulator